VQVVCKGLPHADFTSITFQGEQARKAHGWRWVSWHQTLDMLHEQISLLEKRDSLSQKHLTSVEEASQRILAGVQDALGKLEQKSAGEDADIAAAASLVGQLKDTLGQLTSSYSNQLQECVLAPKASTLPPSMLTKLAEQKLLSDDAVREGQMRRVRTRTMSQAEHEASMERRPSFKERLLDDWKDTTISMCQLQKLLRTIGSDIPEEQIKQVMDAAGMDKGGVIRYGDLVRWITLDANSYR